MNYFNTFFVLVAAICLHGCKTQVIAHKGGDVYTASGQFYCYIDNDGGWYPGECSSEARDTDYDQTFLVRPAPGYKFVGWAKGDDHLCGGSTGPCRLITENFSGYEALMDILASDKTFYLRPLFAKKHTDKSNPLAKYNGMWKFQVSSGVFECSDGETFDAGGGTFKQRFNVEPSGYVEVLYEHYPASIDSAPENFYAALDFENWRNGGEYWAIDYTDATQDGQQYSSEMIATFAKGNSTVMTGTYKITNDYGHVRCEAVLPMTVRRVSR